jgi:hypothetical protein
VAEQIFGDIPALVFLADEVLGRHPDIVEKHLVQMMAAVDRNDRTHRDARRLHVDQQERDALLPPLRRGVGAHQAKAPIGMMRGRGPDLLAVDDVIVAVMPCRRLQRSEVRACPRLGKALAPPIVDIGGPRQKSALLFGGAELDQYRADHRDVERRYLRRRRQLVFLEKDHALDRRPAGAAIFARPVERSPVALVEDALPADGILLARGIAEPHPFADVVRQIAGDEGAQLVAKRQLVGRETQIHG